MSVGAESQQICVVGAGHVGLVTAAGLAKLGHRVTCVDISLQLIALLGEGIIPFHEAGLPELVAEGLHDGRLTFTCSLVDALEHAKYVFVAVATPRGRDSAPDLSQIHQVLTDLAEALRQPAIIIIKSSVPPQLFPELRDLLERRLVEGRDFELVFCPEFLAEGSAVRDFFHPARTIVGAEREQTAHRVGRLFADIGGKTIYTTPASAALMKFASNAFLASRVAFINEIAALCERLSVDVQHVSEALLLDPRLGDGYLDAGIGFSGPCLSKDLSALCHSGAVAGERMPLCDAIARQNDEHLQRIVGILTVMCPAGGTITIFGLSFKAGTSDVRNSRSMELIGALAAKGYTVVATDPEALEPASAVLGDLDISLIRDPIEAARGSDLQAFMVPWPVYQTIDLARVRGVVRVPRIFDGPRVFSLGQAQSFGFEYRGIGRVYEKVPHFAFEK